MILILTSHGDHLADLVIDWLKHYKAKFYRLNNEEVLIKEKINFKLQDNGSHVILNEKYRLEDFQTAWYRKFGSFRDNALYDHSKKYFEGKLFNFYDYEYRAFIDTFFDLFSKDFKWLCNPHSIKNLPKIKQLIIAAKVGLDIPKGIITNNSHLAKSFIRQYPTGSIIKPIGESEIVSFRKTAYYITPRLINLNFFKKNTQIFFPSLIQEYLDKDIELRIFYLDGTCYPMAIFSQLDDATKIDFRNYNIKNPNRFVPFKLPAQIALLIVKFMEMAKLNTGSIDMIKTKCNRYVFLEVNPTGQFGMVSKPCNYYIEKKIASSLIKKSLQCQFYQNSQQG